MSEITIQEVQDFLLKNKFHLKPNQREVSFPVIKRIHTRLQKGKIFSPIKVSDDKIIDGHHRFICLSILGINIEEVAGGINLSFKNNFQWTEVRVVSDDYDSEEEIQYYFLKYDL